MIFTKYLKKIIRSIFTVCTIFVAYNYDFKRYILFSKSLGSRTEYQLLASIIAHYHVLEKGLSMPEPKPVFGKDIVEGLIHLLNDWSLKKYPENVHINASYSVLHKYYLHVGHDRATEIFGLLEFLNDCNSFDDGSGGATLVYSDDIKIKAKGNFSDLVQARRSIRNFSKKDVDLRLIREAVSLAQNSPSVCNRQAARVYCVSQAERIFEILKLQTGNKGFGDRSRVLLIITSDLAVFEGGNERNQSFIDGGLFSMSLMYAITYLGLACCPLNWSVLPAKDKKLRSKLKINETENIIMMLAVGHIEEHILIAKSCRHELDSVLKCLE